MYQSTLPPWPDAGALCAQDGFRVSPDLLRRLGDGNAQDGARQLKLILAAETERKPSGVTCRPANVRLAGPDDETAILQLLFRDVEENASHIAPPSADRILAQIRLGTQQKGGFTAIIDGPDGTPVAVAILNSAQWWWSEQFYLGDIVTYVHPDHRQSRYIDDLLDFERWLSDEMTAQYGERVYLLCGVLGTRRMRAKIMLFWRRFTEVGRAFLYPAPGEA